MDRSPPPFFNQGPSAIALLAVDSRLSVLAALREGVGTMLYPVQRTLLVPRDLFGMSADYLAEIRRLRLENAELRRLEAANAKTLQQAEQLALENTRLRELLEARERVAVRSVMAEVLYEPRDPYTRKAVIDRGLQHGLLAGQPVIDARGVIGQVTRVLPLSSEITLLTDRNHAVLIAACSCLSKVAEKHDKVGPIDFFGFFLKFWRQLRFCFVNFWRIFAIFCVNFGDFCKKFSVLTV